MTRAAKAAINLQALRQNLQCVRRAALASRVMAVIKADAYGHGMHTVARALGDADALAVTCISEAIDLREAGIKKPIVTLQGYSDLEELRAAAEYGFWLVIHHRWQLRLLEKARLSSRVTVWLKVDSGMHRLGFSGRELPHVYNVIKRLPTVDGQPGLLTHLACADELNNPCTRQQIKCFDAAVAGLQGEHSIANSAAVLGFPATHRDWVRPGIMLYGASPFVDAEATEIGLSPVMRLSAPLISVKQHKRGDAIGYGGDYVCPQDMPIGIAAIGYGDGYPRHASSGTPVLINGRRAALAGRVSMDMISIDLRGIERPVPGNEVLLWGDGLPAEEIARHAGTISYELFCGVNSVRHELSHA